MMQASWKIKALLTCVGVTSIVYFLYELDLSPVYQKVSSLGFRGLLLLLPYFCVLLCDTYGWFLLLDRDALPCSFLKVFQIKVFADFINNSLPAGTLVGDALKVKLLNAYQQDVLGHSASVYLARILLLYTHLVYILVAGMFLYFFVHDINAAFGWLPVCIAVLILALLLMYFVFLRQGSVTSVFWVLKQLRVNWRWIYKYQDSLLSFDRKVLSLYKGKSRLLLQALSVFFVGWVFGALELYLFLYFLDVQVTLGAALAIDALNAALKAVVFFVPAGVGVVEVGYIGLFRVFLGVNHSDELAFLFAMMKRVREIIFLMMSLLQGFSLRISFPTLKSLIRQHSTKNT